MKQRLYGDAGKVEERAWSHLAGISVGGWPPSSGSRRFPVFRQDGMDLVCGKAAVGEFLQAAAEIKADVETGALGAGEDWHDGSDGRAAVLGGPMHPVLTAEGKRTHAVLTRSAHPAGSLSAVHLRCAAGELNPPLPARLPSPPVHDITSRGTEP